MTFSKTLLLGFAVVALSACSTTPKFATPGDMLLADLEAPVASAPGLSVPSLSSTSPTCVQFYANTVDFISLPTGGLNAPQGPSLGGQILKTVVLGTLSGLTSGGVSALGINNSFAESALIGTTSQVTYNVGNTLYDDIVGDSIPEVEAPVETPGVPELTPMQEIRKAAGAIGCPAPSESDIAALDL